MNAQNQLAEWELDLLDKEGLAAYRAESGPSFLTITRREYGFTWTNGLPRNLPSCEKVAARRSKEELLRAADFNSRTLAEELADLLRLYQCDTCSGTTSWTGQGRRCHNSEGSWYASHQASAPEADDYLVREVNRLLGAG
jgi:hypothetical protein